MTTASRSLRPRRWQLALGAVALSAAVVTAQDAVGDRVQEILTRMDRADGDGVWNEALALERLGEEAAGPIAARLGAARGPTRVAAAKALLVLDTDDATRGAAIQALKDVLKADGARDLRVRACELLARHGRAQDVQTLTREVEQLRDPYVKIALLKALRLRGRHRPSERALQEYLASEDPSLQAEAALALAECGNVEAAKAVLSRLKHEPTERGRRAAALLEQEALLGKLEHFGGVSSTDELVKMRDRQLESLKGELEALRAQLRAGVPQGGGGGGVDLEGADMLSEIVKRLREQYVDESKVSPQKLLDAMASGMVDGLDPFSSYMSEESLKEFNTSIQQQYGGVGAVVQMDRKTGYLTIQRPIYGNPAHKAGLRTLDRILEVEGQSTKGKRVDELVTLLKGPPGTPVRVLVQPFLGGEQRTISIVRNQITLESTRYDLLPGQIGYVQLGQFGQLATREIEAALVALEGQGMKGLILDLRGNPGGLLSAAVEIADKFLDDDKLIVYAEGRKGTRYGARQDDGGPQIAARRRMQPKHPDYPLVVLVDENAASASEIVAGALQAHGRAQLVGRQTFGKGSVQNVFPLESTGEKAALRMTIAYYFLPDGRCIHREREPEAWKAQERIRFEIERWKQEGIINEAQAKELLEKNSPPPGGVEPDFRVDPLELTPAQQKAYGTILDLQLLEDYIQANWVAHRERLHQLAQWDGFDPKAYPQFDALWANVQEKLDATSRAAIDEAGLRMLVRSYVRRFAQDDLARVLPSDYQEDRQLQAALVIMAEQVGLDVAQTERLAFLGKAFPNGVARTRTPGAPGKPEGEGEGNQRDFK